MIITSCSALSSRSAISALNRRESNRVEQKERELSLVREVPFRLIGYASAGLSQWVGGRGGQIQTGDFSFAPSCIIKSALILVFKASLRVVAAE